MNNPPTWLWLFGERYCKSKSHSLFCPANKPIHMKKILVGGLVGGLLVFIWQTLSWTMLDLHRPAQGYSPKQDSIMRVLSANLTEGGYLLPTVPKGASFDEAIKSGEKMQGKPWASVQYHASFNESMNQMYMNMARSLVTDMIMVCLFCWILGRSSRISPGYAFLAAIFTGLIVYINQPYSQHIWYHTFDAKAHLLDELASWGLCGIWLGWYLPRR
jgi:hypothetical protein